VERKTVGIILTVATTLLCACPGLFCCLFGVITAAGQGTYDQQLFGRTGAGSIPPAYGWVLVVAGALLVLIPVIVGIITARTKR
jgi:hypothetical protein